MLRPYRIRRGSDGHPVEHAIQQLNDDDDLGPERHNYAYDSSLPSPSRQQNCYGAHDQKDHAPASPRQEKNHENHHNDHHYFVRRSLNRY